MKLQTTTNDINTTTYDFVTRFQSNISPFLELHPVIRFQAMKIEVNDNTKSSNLKQIGDVLKSKFHEIILFFHGCHLLSSTK